MEDRGEDQEGDRGERGQGREEAEVEVEAEAEEEVKEALVLGLVMSPSPMNLTIANGEDVFDQAEGVLEVFGNHSSHPLSLHLCMLVLMLLSLTMILFKRNH